MISGADSESDARIAAEISLTYIFISHNLSVVRKSASKFTYRDIWAISSEYAEEGTVRPAASVHEGAAGGDSDSRPSIPTAMQDMLEGDVPSPINPPKGCCFHTRYGCCKVTAQKRKMINVGNDHWVACCKV